MGITGDIANSVALLRKGRRLKVGVGRLHYGHSRHWFLEVAALGLLSDLYPLADDIQHGKLTMIGELLSTFVSATPSRLRMIHDGRRKLDTSAHMLVISNMPFLGPHFQISPNVSFMDGRLDVFTFSDMNKLNMISYAMLSQIGHFARHWYQALSGYTNKDPFDSAYACACRWYSAWRGFLIRSYPDYGALESDGRLSPYWTMKTYS